MFQITAKNRSKLVLFLLFIVALAVGYQYRSKLQNIEQLFQTAPCTRPITYKVGSFDTRFGITEEKFKQAISEAAQIWSDAAGRQLFQYQDSGTMPISLVYDSRQQATDQLRKLNLNVDNTEASYNQLKNAYLKYKTQYEAQKQKYASDLALYNAKKKTYEQEVQYWNSHGGASPQEYQKLKEELDQLNSMGDSLNQEIAALNQLVENINALATTLNRIGTELNVDVSAYNTASKNLGEFEEGLYTVQNLQKKIEIYQFDNYLMLVRVLAHELGHSLGLEHVPDADAIMNKLNQSNNLKPTAGDVAELKRACKL